jgi:hypothetical protein
VHGLQEGRHFNAYYDGYCPEFDLENAHYIKPLSVRGVGRWP